MITLGDLVKDSVTGFTGIVVARTEWLHGCVRMSVQPQKLVDGKIVDTATFDVPQLILLKSASVKNGSSKNGGPRDDAKALRRD